MNIALIYDRINKFGGAERVLQAIHDIFPQAPLYTGVYHPKKAAWAKGWDIRPSFINKLPFAKNNHEAFFWLMPNAFESFNLDAFDVIISITSAEAKGVLTKPHQLHLCYLLTSTRYLWSHTHQYQGHGLKRLATAPLFSKHRRWDFIAAMRPDHLITISQHVSRRSQHYYHRTPDAVIYPPVRSAYFSQTPSSTDHQWRKQNVPPDYYLIVSRLVDYKSIDTVIQAFNHLPNEHLVIVGHGRARSTLQKNAANNCHFLGTVTDQHLRVLYHQAKALIFPQEEDFGITALEAQAAGTPVIAYKKGGALETIKPHQTGVFYQAQSPQHLRNTLAHFQPDSFYGKTIRAHASHFNESRFKKQFTDQVTTLWQKKQT